MGQAARVRAETEFTVERMIDRVYAEYAPVSSTNPARFFIASMCDEPMVSLRAVCGAGKSRTPQRLTPLNKI